MSKENIEALWCAVAFTAMIVLVTLLTIDCYYTPDESKAVHGTQSECVPCACCSGTH